MRLFLDTNVVTCMAVFEPFLIEGPSELPACAANWAALQREPLEGALQREVEALRVLYLLDEQCHFEWLCSDVAVAEIRRIRDVRKLSSHRALLARLLEHRDDVYGASGTILKSGAVEHRCLELFPNLKSKQTSDAHQFCEAELLDADYFLTSDVRFIRLARRTPPHVCALVSCRPSELPFVSVHLRGGPGT